MSFVLSSNQIVKLCIILRTCCNRLVIYLDAIILLQTHQDEWMHSGNFCVIQSLTLVCAKLRNSRVVCDCVVIVLEIFAITLFLLSA